VLGEALIDLVDAGDHRRFTAHPGGSPLNVAVGLARLGHPTSMLARLATDGFGQLLRQHALASGVILDSAPTASEPTTLAVASLDDAGRADYAFYINGTADWQWTAPELILPADSEVLHFGSLASWLPPGDALIAEFAARAGRGALVSYDPNVRPRLLGEPRRARALVERNIATAHLVKASDEDARWLYPGDSLEVVARRWLGLGPALVVLTLGPDGATAYRDGCEPLPRPAPQAAVVDTVGAGDAFTSGLLGALSDRGVGVPELAEVADSQLVEVIDEAGLVAALTCEQAGAFPPTRAELRARQLAARP